MNANIFDSQTFSLPHISTMNEVKQFVNYLINGVNINLHPDDDFADYSVVSKNGIRSLTKDEVSIGNRLMNECFLVCENNHMDVYEIVGHFILEHINNTRKNRTNA